MAWLVAYNFTTIRYGNIWLTGIHLFPKKYGFIQPLSIMLNNTEIKAKNAVPILKMVDESSSQLGEIKVVMHLIYELKKGIRNLVLCTLHPSCAEIIKQRLEKQGITYLTQRLKNGNVNLFFGEYACINAVSSFIHKPLNLLTPEEDFMLGAMLGYDLVKQSQRFCERKAK